MTRFSMVLLFVGGAAFCDGVRACSIEGRWPTSTELAASSALVFVAHVIRVEALGAEDEKFMREWPSNMVPGRTYRTPTAPAEFALVRTLKGVVPMPSRLSSSSMNCSGVFLEPGRDYLIFASLPEGNGLAIDPIKGSFAIVQEPPVSQSELHDVETFLQSGKSSEQ